MRAGSPGILVIESGSITKTYKRWLTDLMLTTLRPVRR